MKSFIVLIIAVFNLLSLGASAPLEKRQGGISCFSESTITITLIDTNGTPHPFDVVDDPACPLSLEFDNMQGVVISSLEYDSLHNNCVFDPLPSDPTQHITEADLPFAITYIQCQQTCIGLGIGHCGDSPFGG